VISTTGEILGHKRYGDHYHSLTVVAPEIGERAKPGQFVNIKCGDNRASILRRPFSVYRVHKRGGWAPTVEVVFDIRGPGTRYLSQLRGHDNVELIGPLGRGFSLPSRRAHCLLVGGGVGAAPLFFLADALRSAGHRVDFILGARSAALLLNSIDVRRLASVYKITTEDGSQGEIGRVTDVMPAMLERCNSEVVYTCGPHPMLAAVSRTCVDAEVPVQVAVEELMACGWGVCMTCVMPVRTSTERGGGEGEVRYARSCSEGPIFNGARVVWDGASGEPVEEDRIVSEEGELTPTGAATRHQSRLVAPGEHPPPGN
jgi:dihydroorotate dehydrogenase electron transfer subunit